MFPTIELLLWTPFCSLLVQSEQQAVYLLTPGTGGGGGCVAEDDVGGHEDRGTLQSLQTTSSPQSEREQCGGWSSPAWLSSSSPSTPRLSPPDGTPGDTQQENRKHFLLSFDKDSIASYFSASGL